MQEHDAAYKALFSDPNLVADLIQGFVGHSWVHELDLSSLELVNAGFVSEQFQRRESDVVWRVRFRDDWLYVYILIEFQSTVDRFMALRLLVYIGLLYQRLIEEGLIGPREKLPPVLPIVLYNGNQPWWAPQELEGLFAPCPSELAEFRPRFRYLLLDEQRFSSEELSGMKNLAALVFQLEQCRSPEDLQELVGRLQEWASSPEHRETVKRLARWVFGLLWQGKELPSETELDLEELQDRGIMLRERIKQWEVELLERGIQQGFEQGKQQSVEVLLRQLRNKFGRLPEWAHRRVQEANSEQLLQWAERILTAQRLEEVFGE